MMRVSQADAKDFRKFIRDTAPEKELLRSRKNATVIPEGFTYKKD